MRKHLPLIIVVAGVASILGVYVWREWLSANPEREVRALLDEAADAFSRADTQAILGMLDDGFVGYVERGRIDRDEAEGTLNALFQTFGPVRVTFVGPVRIEAREATVVAWFRTRVGSRASAGSPWEAEWKVAFMKRADRWTFTRVTRLGSEGLQL